MRKYFTKLLFVVVCLLCNINTLAYDFEVDGIYYNIISAEDLTCRVTYEGYYNSYSSSIYSGSYYTGDISIPQSVEYENKVYKVVSIGNNAFYNCSDLTSVYIPSSIKTIGEQAFYGCSNILSIVIPNSVTSIGKRVLYACGRLASVVIGSGVTFVDEIFSSRPAKVIWLSNTPPVGYNRYNSSYNYYNCGKVNYVANDSYEFASYYGTRYIYDQLSSMFEVDGVIYVPVSLSERTCDIIDCSYSDKANKIDLKRTVTYKGVTMNLQNFRSYAFYDNDFIKELTIDIDGEIPQYAFYSCGNIPEVKIGSSITTIGSYAFYGCKSLVSATIENTGDISESAFRGSSCSEPATVIINNHGNIGSSAFSGCSSLVSATIENERNIGSYAFSDCSSLTSIELRNVGSIGDDAFLYCSSTETLCIAPTVTSIGNYVFYGCSKIGDVTIEDRETDLSLGSNGSSPLFSSCPLDEVYIGGKIVYDTSSSSGYSPFYRNTSLRTVTITDKETTIYDNEFYGCTGLKNVKIGDGVTSFGKYAFSGCSAIESFEFGAHVETIGEEAFSDCTSMTKMTSHNPVPPICGTEALDDIVKWECTLYVPETAEEAYKAANQWKEFVFVESFNSTGIDNVPVKDNGKTEAARYDMAGNKVSEAYKGIVIILYTDGTRMKVLNK